MRQDVETYVAEFESTLSELKSIPHSVYAGSSYLRRVVREATSNLSVVREVLAELDALTAEEWEAERAEIEAGISEMGVQVSMLRTAYAETIAKVDARKVDAGYGAARRHRSNFGPAARQVKGILRRLIKDSQRDAF